MPKSIGRMWFILGIILWLVLDQTYGIVFFVMGMFWMINGEDDD